jgi:cytochrome c oxidase subunit 2
MSLFLNNRLLQIFICAVVITPGMVLAEYDLNMTRGVTSVSREIYGLHMLAFIMVSCIGLVVFGIMIWSIIHHRKSRGVTTSQFRHSNKWETVWAIIPILILLSFGAPAGYVFLSLC